MASMTSWAAGELAPEPQFTRQRRIDPSDGQARTFAEFQEKYSSEYTLEQIEIFWRQCDPVPTDAAVNDPFLTHQRAAQSTRNRPAQDHTPGGGAGEVPAGAPAQPTAPAAAASPQGADGLPPVTPWRSPTAPHDPPHGSMAPGAPSYGGPSLPPMPAEPFGPMQVDLGRNPFLTGFSPDRGREARQDPFLTHGTEGVVPTALKPPPPPRIPLPPKKHWYEVLTKVLGAGDVDRKKPARTVLICGPWLLFMWVLLLGVCLRHYSNDTALALTGFLYFGSLLMIYTWYSGKRWGPVSLLSLGLLCLLAVFLGHMLGYVGWSNSWRQYWWMQTGQWFPRTRAGTPAGSRADAAVLHFNDVSGTTNGTSVDDSRAIGYKDVNFYCVAPILSPDVADATLIRVNYWAVGINCCQELGSFTCDDSRDSRGSYGVVMLQDGFPCPGCNANQFRAAVTKAESVHGLVSVPDALFVRWVINPETVRVRLLLDGLLFLFVAATIGAFVFCVLGFLVWYYGWGKRKSLEEMPLEVSGRLKAV